MQRRTLKVELLSHTPFPLDVIYLACRQCYYKGSIADVDLKAIPVEKKEALVRKVVSSGHESPLEHVSFTFAVEGISRACSHQLVRHRIASYSQQSQRYVELKDLPFVIPPSIEKVDTARKRFLDVISAIETAYQELIAILEQEYGAKGESVYQDARYILPNACETKLVVTMNTRELIHFFAQRCCTRAQWEIRALAYKMLELVRAVLPVVFDPVGPKCELLGYCPEGEFSCGRYPLKEEVLGGKSNEREEE